MYFLKEGAFPPFSSYGGCRREGCNKKPALFPFSPFLPWHSPRLFTEPWNRQVRVPALPFRTKWLLPFVGPSSNRKPVNYNMFCFSVPAIKEVKTIYWVFFLKKKWKRAFAILDGQKWGSRAFDVYPAQGWCFQTHTSNHTQWCFPRSFERKDWRQLDEVGRLRFLICKMGRAPSPSQDCYKDYYPKCAFKNSTVKRDINISSPTRTLIIKFIDLRVMVQETLQPT